MRDLFGEDGVVQVWTREDEVDVAMVQGMNMGNRDELLGFHGLLGLRWFQLAVTSRLCFATLKAVETCTTYT